jgi:hypothetical protein
MIRKVARAARNTFPAALATGTVLWWKPGSVPGDPLGGRSLAVKHSSFRAQDLPAVVLDVADLLHHADSEEVIRFREPDTDFVINASARAPYHRTGGAEGRLDDRDGQQHPGSDRQRATGAAGHAAETDGLHPARRVLPRTFNVDFDRNVCRMPQKATLNHLCRAHRQVLLQPGHDMRNEPPGKTRTPDYIVRPMQGQSHQRVR